MKFLNRVMIAMWGGLIGFEVTEIVLRWPVISEFSVVVLLIAALMLVLRIFILED